MQDDYEWAPIPGTTPEGEAILAALKDRAESDETVKTMVIGDSGAERTKRLTNYLRNEKASVVNRHGKAYAQWIPNRKPRTRTTKKAAVK